MNKQEIITRYAKEYDIPKTQAEIEIARFIDLTSVLLVEGEEINFSGCYKMGVKKRTARTARNPQTGESISIPAHKAPYCKFGSKLKEGVKL